jgi:hypothetical protein
MNNKFEELKKQCGCEKHWDVTNSKWVDSQIDLDEFAKLIINECAGAIVKEVNNWQQLAPFNNIIKQRGVLAIKNHFGL